MDDVLDHRHSPLSILQNIHRNHAPTQKHMKSKPLHDLNLDYLQNKSHDSPTSFSITSHPVETPIVQPPKNPKDVSEWASQCRALVLAKNFTQLEASLDDGHSLGYSMDGDTFNLLITELSMAKQHYLVVFTFKRFQPTESEIARESVLEAIGSAYAIRDHAGCEEIFAAYLGKVEFPIKTLNTVLKNFFAQTNPQVGKQFLMQVWDRVNEKSLQIAFKGMTNISRDANEIVNLMYKFKEERGQIGEQLYATVLECLLDLGHRDLMIDVTRTIEADGLFGTARVQEVILQQLLLEKNAGRIEAYLTLFEQQNKIIVSPRPFERAAVYFSRSADTDGILTIVNWMSHCNLDITAAVMNAFLSCVVRSGNSTKLVDNLEGWIQLGVVGTNATVNLIWKGLLKKYPDHGELITAKLRDMRNKFPKLYKGLSADTFTTTKMIENGEWDSQGVVVMPSSEDKNGTLYALRRIQELNRSNTPQLGIEVVEDMIRREVKPTAQIFSSVLYGLCKAGLSSEFDVALKMMEDAGYAPEPMLKLIFLRTHLRRMREVGGSSLPTYTQKVLAVQRIKQFVFEHRSQINLKMATSIGFELLSLEEVDYAINMFNYFREPDSKLHGGNHDSDSLSGLVKALATKGHFHEIVQVVSEVLQPLQDMKEDGSDNGTAGIVLRPFFEWQLQDCVVRAQRLNNSVIVDAMKQQLELVQAYRQVWTAKDIEHSLKVVLGIFTSWEDQIETK